MSSVAVVPKHALLFGVLAAAVATAGMPFIEGYGTVLAQIVGLNAWALVASVTSETYADQNHLFLWPTAAALNVVLYSIVAVPVYFWLRHRAPWFAAAFLAAWLLFYVACLFLLFPATDGP